MRAKNVHFASFNTYLVPPIRAPPPPSPNTSEDSPPPSSRHRIDTAAPGPGVLPGPTPYVKARRGSVTASASAAAAPPLSIPARTRAASFSSSQARVQLHTALEFSSSSGPAIKYDLVDIPGPLTLGLSSSYARAMGASTRSSSSLSRLLDEPATVPSVQSMTIICPHIPWAIRVLPSSSPSSSRRHRDHHSSSSSSSPPRQHFVTIRDVLSELYTSLRTPIIHAEYALLPTERARDRAGRAYKRRYRRLEDEQAYEEEKLGGLRRVDFLMERTRFGGLSSSSSSSPPLQLQTGNARKEVGGGAEWVLNVE